MSEVKSERGFDHVDLPQSGLNDLDAAAEPICSASAVKLIFLHSSWRTSSTWFWAKFRPFLETACYYEPFNDELTTIEQEKAASVHDTSWDSGHPPVDPYRLEYLPMIQPTGGMQLFEPSMHLDWFTPVGGLRGELRPAEIQYLALLIDQAREQGKIPVFGETRSLGRMWAIQNSFGGFHVFLHRNLWRQWLSYLYYRRRSNHYFYETTAFITARSADPFLADMANFYVERALDLRLRRDGEENRPLSDDERVRLLRSLPESDAFAMFMALHIYLYLHAQLTADLTVDVTKLSKDSGYRSRIENELARQTGLEISLSDVANGEPAKGVAISAAAIDWNEIREHARLAVQILSAFGDSTKLTENASEFVDSAVAEMCKSEAALIMRGDAADEIWYARLQEARCHWELGDDNGFVRQALDLRNERPQRAEPLYDLARFHRERGMHETAADFAEAGLAVERPGLDAGFVEDFVYQSGLREELSIAAFYCPDPARKDRGFAACNWLALSREIPEGTRSLARGHLRFYVAPASTLMPSFTARPLDFMPPEGWHATNPSVARQGDGLIIVQRTVNYVLESGEYRTPDSAPITTRNFLLRLNSTLDIDSAVEILPPSNLPAPVYGLALGFEDLRLFSWRGALWCSATLRELTPEGWCQQVLARIDESADGRCRLTHWRVLAPEGPPRHEKNWMPLVEPAEADSGEERLRCIYLCDPTRLLDAAARVIAETPPPIAAEQFRGGSQAIAFGGGWLALIHEEVAGGTFADRAYHHRFVWFDRAVTLRSVSRPFFLQKHGVEFVAGLAWHPDGRRLVVTYGVGDGESWIATIAAEDVSRTLEDATHLPSGRQSAVDDGIVVLGANGASASAIAPPCSDLIDPSDGVIVENWINGKKVRFFVTNPNDAIMQYHAKGQFYEAEELVLIARHFKEGGIFVDIGANTGNHSIYVSKFLAASKILAFEPNQAATDILRKNLLLNECKNVDTQFLGIALGSGKGRVHGTTPEPNNLGHTVYSENSSGEVSVVDGDSLILQEPIEFIKIDVEGMEIEILVGLKQTIRRWRPNLFIEVWDWKLPEFRKWCGEEGYEVAEHFERYLGIQNYVLTPSLPPPAVQGDTDANERAQPKQPDSESGTAPTPDLQSFGGDDFVSQLGLLPARDLKSRLDVGEANSVSGRVIPNAPRNLAFITAATDHGTMIVNRFDYYLLEQDRSFGVGFQLLEKSCYEPDEVDFLLRLLDRRRQYYGDGVVAIDCGANIGVHTIEFAKHMTGWGTVLGFEAQERIYYALAGNIAINNCFNARAIHAALTSQPGTIKIPAPNYSVAGSFGSLELRKRDNTEWIGQPIDYSESRMVDVQAINLDSFNFVRLDLIKIDVEGMELEVLAGGTKCIHNLHPILQVETLKTDQNALRAWLEGHGYSVVTHGINFLAIHRDDKCLGHL